MKAIKFRQPIFSTEGNFAYFHYWGFIDGGFSSPTTDGRRTVVDAEEKSQMYTGVKDNTKWMDLTAEEQLEWVKKGNTDKDWNGKEIYEGDVVRFINSLVAKIEWHSGGFCADWETECEELSRIVDLPKQDKVMEFEIIGNIYEGINEER